MKKRILTTAAALLLLACLCPARAGDVLAAQSEALDLDGLEDAAGDYLPGADSAVEAGISLDEGIQTHWTPAAVRSSAWCARRCAAASCC